MYETNHFFSIYLVHDAHHRHDCFLQSIVSFEICLRFTICPQVLSSSVSINAERKKNKNKEKVSVCVVKIKSIFIL